MNLIADNESQCIEGNQAGTAALVGKTSIPLTACEWSYIQDSIKPWTHENGCRRYLLCKPDENPAMQLQTGYCFRLRTANELAQDTDHPLYPVIWVDFTLSGGDGEDPLGMNIDGSNPITIDAQVEDAEGKVLPFSKSWRIPFYDLQGNQQDTIKITFTDGVAQKQVAPYAQSKCITYQLLSKDFALVQAFGTVYQIKFKTEPILLKIYRE